MKEKKLVPKKRFKSYTGKWNLLLLGNHSIIKGRLGWKNLRRDEYVDEGPSMIAGRHIKNGTIDWNAVDHIPVWRYEESPEIMLEENDVIFSKDGTLGNPAILRELKGQTTINATMMLVRVRKDLHPEFFYQILNTKYFFELIRLKVSGSSIPHLFQEDMNNFTFYAPNLKEQQKIGEFFKVLDERIANQERKISKVKALKEAYLTEMFPQEGETVPKRRFKGFEKEWEFKKLDDIAFYRRGSFPQPYGEHKWYNGIGAMPFVQVVDVDKNLRLVDDTKQKISQLAQPHSVYVEKGKILVTLQGSIGRVAITQYPSYVDRTLLIFEDYKLQMDNNYFAYILEQLFKIEKKKAPGGTIKTITKEALSEFVISVPSYEEQQKIGTFFKNLDDQIRAEEAKLEKLKKMKEAYLEEMFV